MTEAVHSKLPLGSVKYSLPTVVAGIEPCVLHTPDAVTSNGRSTVSALTPRGSAPGADCAGSRWLCGGTARSAVIFGSGTSRAAAIRAGVQYRWIAAGSCVDFW